MMRMAAPLSALRRTITLQDGEGKSRMCLFRGDQGALVIAPIGGRFNLSGASCAIIALDFEP
jgi:hypothetical protein